MQNLHIVCNNHTKFIYKQCLSTKLNTPRPTFLVRYEDDLQF